MRQGRVVVVDDNAELAENLVDTLRGLTGWTLDVHIIGTAAEALECCRQAPGALDLALVDLRLPDSDGLTLTRQLRELCPFAQLVIITGDATVESAAAAVGHGAFAYVLKPFQPKALLQTAEKALTQAMLLRERETLLERLEESERRHREVVDAVPAFVLALDAQGNVVLWNRRLEEVTGRSAAEMVGSPGRELIGQGGDRSLAGLGIERTVRWQLATMGGAEPKTYALGIDVTEERAMLRRTLRAERLAAVGTLAAGLAHEVRNPLNSASLQLQVLRRRIEKGGSRPELLLPVVAVVVDEVQRLDRLVNDFLSFARPGPLNVYPTALDELVQSVAAQLSPELAHAGVEQKLELGSVSIEIEVDKEQLRQVLLNLVRNATEAMPTGGLVTIRTKGPDEQSFATIEVEDTGPGISDETPVFDAFFTTKETGTGLGLAIVHRIVTEHGGTISYESEPGRTCFCVKLPLATESE